MSTNLALTMLGCFALGLSVANFADAAIERLACRRSSGRFVAWGMPLMVNGATLAWRCVYGVLV